MAEQVWQLLIINPGTLNIEDLKSFLKIIKFNPQMKNLFPKGLLLSEPVNNNTGGILFPKDTELNGDYIQKLVQLKENNPEYDFKLSIKKSHHVAEYFRGFIKRDFNKLVESKKSKQEFRKSIGRLEKTLELYLDDILKDDELIYTLFRGRSIDELTSKSGIPTYFYHSVNVAIYALELIQNARFTTGVNFEKHDLVNLAKMGLLHDIGGLENLGDIVHLSLENKRKEYLKSMVNSTYTARSLNMEDEIVDALKQASEFHQGNYQVLHTDDEGMTNHYLNVLVMADVMDMKVSGLFEDAVPIKAAVDQLFTLANNKVFKKSFVDALAKGLKMNDLFDFYFELNRLNNACIQEKWARPYPMLGFKSPVLYLCGGNRNDCKYYAKSAKAVNLIKPSSGMEPGQYGRCNLLSAQLQKFYESHYNDIKENIILEQNSKKKSE